MNHPRLRLVTDPVARHDGSLLARVAAGEIHALGSLYDAYAPMLLRFVRRLGAGPDAEDVVQTVFLRVVRLAANFDANASSARSWLFTIAVRIVQERRRALRRLAAAMRSLAQQKSASSTTEAPSTSDLERCLQGLSLAKRTVVVLADIEGFSCDEIATMLQIPVGTVWTRLHHARRELRAAWSDKP